MLFETSGDVLNMSIAIGVIVLTVFLSILIFYVIMIVRDAAKVVDKTTEVVDKVHKTVIQPLRAVDYLIERVKPYIEMAIDKKNDSKRKSED